MTATAYLEKYFECVDNMPLEVQRHVSHMREVELETTHVMSKIERLRCELVQSVSEGEAPTRQQAILAELKRLMLKAREIGDAKLDMSSQMLNIAEEHSQQLDLRAKELDSNLRSDDHHHPPRYNAAHSSNSSSSIKENPLALLSESASEAKHIKRTSSSKRPRPPLPDKSPGQQQQQQQQPPPQPAPPLPEEESGNKESNGGAGSGRSRENSTTSIASGLSQAKPPKKKIKLKKKVAVKEPSSAVFLPTSSHVPMPDLTSQPLDPNEPLYCLCHQVSFGEMIGCDNDNCLIEWFHFQCVGLTSKPKGKWFCPKCSQDRKAKASSK